MPANLERKKDQRTEKRSNNLVAKESLNYHTTALISLQENSAIWGTANFQDVRWDEKKKRNQRSKLPPSDRKARVP